MQKVSMLQQMLNAVNEDQGPMPSQDTGFAHAIRMLFLAAALITLRRLEPSVEEFWRLER